jgi:hypothetical protein
MLITRPRRGVISITRICSPELAILERFRETLVRKDIPEGYIHEDLEWIDDRARIYSRTRWRIGIAGVTSSGKSTLINAIMGEDILPRDSRPTSSVLVSCAVGQQRRATIFTEDGEQHVLEGETLCSQAIAEYADEKCNPGNTRGVGQIHLVCPTCLLPEGMEIVDSPGLDAFGLSRHEVLTLRHLVPSCDLVVYLTTTKANSDRSNLSALDAIASEDKPVIVVQNFLDTVEPEIGSGGVERRSREEVAQLLRSRVQTLLDQAQTASLRHAPIIQVSAVEGLKARLSGEALDGPRWAPSQLGMMLDAIVQAGQHLEGRRIEHRVKQVERYIADTIRRCRADDAWYAGVTEETEKLLQDVGRFREIIENLSSAEHEAYDQIEQEMAELDQEFGRVFDSLVQGGPTERKRSLPDPRPPQFWKSLLTIGSSLLQIGNRCSIEEASSRLQELALETQARIINRLDVIETREAELFWEMNLTLDDDKRRGRPQLEIGDSPRAKYREEAYVYTWQEKKSNGILGISRLWRWITRQSDYETHSETRTRKVLDERQSLERMTNYAGRIIEKIRQLAAAWTRDRQDNMGVLLSELHRLERVHAQRKDKPTNRESLLRLISDLAVLADESLVSEGGGGSRAMPRIQQASSVEPSVLQPVTFGLRDWSTIECLLNIASRQRRLYHQAFMWSILESLRPRPKGTTLVVWGRDRRDLELFCANMFGLHVVFQECPQPSLEITLPATRALTGFSHLVLVDGAATQGDTTTSLHSNGEIGLAIITLDLMQIGATLKHLHDSYVDLLRHRPHAYLVQSIIEHVHNDSLVQAYIHYRSICRDYPTPVGCLVNNVSPFYSALFYLADRHNFRGGAGEEHQIAKELDAMLSTLLTRERRHEAGDFFRRVSYELAERTLIEAKS